MTNQRKARLAAVRAIAPCHATLPVHEDTSVFAFTNSPLGRMVVYGAVLRFPSPSDCVWLVPGTENVWGML